ncbi:uncharacterized protein LOC125371184 [Ricinus communis]|uniref:uncharacterized protein LOC125371184 n=1 Tax=Ricinus communis TaxID=3988 RepID=UPI00201A9B67|nr:uncharacterized protein LOC125371184 [Ricinus communis]
MTLNEECLEIFQNKLLEKPHDPGTFTIPYIIGNLSVNDALANLGASINVMPYNLFAKLGLGETKPTRMSIQLVDRSIKYPRGRPFLATPRVMIDVCDGKLKLRVGDETVTFDLHNSISQSLDHNNVLMLLRHSCRKIGVQKLRPSLEELLVLDLKELP